MSACEHCGKWHHPGERSVDCYEEENRDLRARVKALEGRIGVMATMARPTMGECPPGKDGAGSECEDCPESMKCEECWREWGLR